MTTATASKIQIPRAKMIGSDILRTAAFLIFVWASWGSVQIIQSLAEFQGLSLDSSVEFKYGHLVLLLWILADYYYVRRNALILGISVNRKLRHLKAKELAHWMNMSKWAVLFIPASIFALYIRSDYTAMEQEARLTKAILVGTYAGTWVVLSFSFLTSLFEHKIPKGSKADILQG